MRFSILFFILFSSFSAWSQKGIIKVMDAENRQAIVYANLVFRDLITGKINYAITSGKGIVINPAKNLSFISISYTGYKTLQDTIRPGESKTYFLQTDVFQMEQVVVTATRTPKSLKEVPVITRVITAQQIQARGLTDIEEVLEADLPGIEFNRHGTSNDISIQGLEARNILVLIDGERLAGETRGNIDYSRLNVNDIERIEIVKGASSALYGSQAMGSVINIITKQSTRKLYANLSIKYTGKFEVNYPDLQKNDEDYAMKLNLDKPNLNWSALWGFNLKNWRGKTSFFTKATDAYQLYDREALVKKYIDIDTVIYEALNTNPVGIEGTSDYSITQSLGYTFNKKFQMDAKLSFYRRHKYDFVRDNLHDKYEDMTYGIQARYQPQQERSFVLSYHSDTYDKYDYYEKLDSSALNYRHRYKNPKLIAHWKLNLKHNLTAGWEYLHESLLSDMFVYGDLQKKKVSNINVFLQDDIKPHKRWNLVSGFRAEYHTAYGMHFSPKLSLMHKLFPVVFRVNYASGFRSPDLKELYMNWNHLGMFTIRGNKNLKPETNRYFSVSAEWTQKKLNTSITLYKNYFKDKIQGIWLDNQTVYQYVNTDKSSLSGIDYMLRYKLSNSFIFKLAYSYVNDDNYQDGVRLSAVSPHSGNLQLTYKLTKKKYHLEANLTGKYIGDKDFMVADEIEYRGVLQTAYYEVHYDAYTIWRFSLSQDYNRTVNWVLGIDNLFDYRPDMITFNTSTDPGRRYFIKLNINIDRLLTLKV